MSAESALISQSRFEYRQHTKAAPKGYTRPDESIREELCRKLAYSDAVDVREVEVSVDGGVVELTGSVQDRRQKRWIEELAAQVSGVRDVLNRIRTAQRSAGGRADGHISGISHASPATGSSASSYGGGVERGNADEFPKGRDTYGGTTNPMKSVT